MKASFFNSEVTRKSICSLILGMSGSFSRFKNIIFFKPETPVCFFSVVRTCGVSGSQVHSVMSVSNVM